MQAYVIGSGSKGNATIIKDDENVILIDMGLSYKRLKEELKLLSLTIDDISTILITHEHRDHINGLTIMMKYSHATLYVGNDIYEYMQKYLNYDNIQIINDNLTIGNITVQSIVTSHDSISHLGFILDNTEESLVYITDTGYLPQKYFKMLENKNYYILESNHDIQMLENGIYPEYLKRRIEGKKGHLSNSDAGSYLSKLIGNDTKGVVLAHLSEENNTEMLALSTVEEVLNENGVSFNNIKCAKQRQTIKVTL